MKIHTECWNISYDERLSWLGCAVSVKSPGRPRTTTQGLRAKDATRSYCFSSTGGEKIIVCRAFFLSTLGLSTDKMIVTSMKKKTGMFIKGTPDQRGRHEPCDVSEAIQYHIRSYGSSISHYRREHAPNRLYLSLEFNISSMFNDFKEQHPEYTIHYST